MTRYFFHLHNDIDSPDIEGQDFPDDRSALHGAMENVRGIASEDVRHGHLNLGHFIICVDDGGREVGIVRFADAVKIAN